MFFKSVVLFAVLVITAQASGCPGDFDNNRQVDFADFLAFAVVFGGQQGDAGYNAAMDLDTNGAIDLADFLAFAKLFGKPCVVELTRLTNSETIELHPTWSPPDGRKIAYLSGFVDPELWVMNADGGDSIRLATSITVDTELYTTLAWSPDGEHIAFSSARDGNAEIYKVGAMVKVSLALQIMTQKIYTLPGHLTAPGSPFLPTRTGTLKFTWRVRKAQISHG